MMSKTDGLLAAQGETHLMPKDRAHPGQSLTECQEYYQNSALFSQFLLILYCTNNFTLLSFNFLTISDHQQKQETCILVSSTATNNATPPHCHHTPDQ